MTSRAEWPAASHECAGWSGEMAQRIAAFDWSCTALGPRAAWSNSLNAAVQMLLASPVPLVMLWGKPGTMVYNDAYAGFAGGRHPFLLGQPVEMGWPEIADFNRHVVDTGLAGGTLSYADKQLTLHRNGRPEEVWMDLHYSPVVEDDGSPAGVMAIVFETTSRVVAQRQREVAEDELHRLMRTLEERVAHEVRARADAEDRLRQVQRLEAIGGLTGGVAHDFNNVLQIISANLQLIDIRVRDDMVLKQRVKTASSAVARGAKLASQLLAFARRQPLSPAVISPVRLFESMSELLHKALPESIHLEMTLCARPWNLRADQSQLENALLNLVINSRDAIDGQGHIRIEVANATALTDERVVGFGTPDDEYVRLSVTDDGRGMPEHVKARVFEPFYSTKPEGHGTGLGLSMVFGFARQSAGHVDIETQVGAGTTVLLYFPRALEEATAEERKPGKHKYSGGETILVVEDDPDVRMAAIDMLSQLGYRVLSAHDGDAALATLQRGERIDLLFTDVVMPGTVRSSELARIASAPPHNAKVVFGSGYTRDVIFHEGRLDEGVVLLSKPYSLDDLAKTIRDTLDL